MNPKVVLAVCDDGVLKAEDDFFCGDVVEGVVAKDYSDLPTESPVCPPSSLHVAFTQCSGNCASHFFG